MKTILIFLILSNYLLSQINDSTNSSSNISTYLSDFTDKIKTDTISSDLSKSDFNTLLLLTNSSNPLEKTLAFHYILKYKEADIYQLLLKNISDTTKLTVIEGCFLNRTNVSDYLIQFSDEKKYPENKTKLTRFQKKQLDSIILYSDKIGDKSLNNVLKRLKPKKKYYQRVKYLAYNKNNYFAYKLLLKYKKPENIMSEEQFLEMIGAPKLGLGKDAKYIIVD